VTESPSQGFVPFPETPRLVEARIAEHPAGLRDCLVAKTEDGQHLDLGFQAEGERPGPQIVDARLWLKAAHEPADSPQVVDAVAEINADDWLQAVSDPVGNGVGRIKEAHPAAFETWFSQRQYESGVEEGSGGSV
jgi:hypothetical protein